MNRYRKLLKDSAIFAIGGFASKAMSFFLIPFYAMYLSTEQFGTADLTITTVNFLLPVMSLSLADAVLRFSYDSSYKTTELLRCAYTEMYFSVVVLFIIVVLNEVIFSLFSAKYILYGICIYFLQNSGLILSNYLKANSKLGLYTVQGFVSTLLMLTSNILFLAVFKTGVDGYLMSIVISSFAGNMIMICFGRIPLLCFLPLRKPEVLKDMMMFSIPIVPSTIAWWINTSADKYMITGLISAGSNGLYSMAHKLPSMLTVIASFFGSAWQLSVIDNVDKNDNKFFVSLMYDSYCFVCLAICSLGIAFSQRLGFFFLKADFFEGYVVIPLLFVATVFSSISGFLGSISIAKRNTKDLAKSTVIGAVVNIILNFFFINIFGIIGAALATAVSFAIIAFLRIKPILQSHMIGTKSFYRSIFLFAVVFICALLSVSSGRVMIISGISSFFLVIIFYKQIWTKILHNIFNMERRK